VAAAVEDSAGIDDHARRVNLSGYHAFGFNFDPTLGEDNAVEAAGYYNAIPLDLAFDLGAFTQDYGLLGDDVAFDIAVDAERAGNRERAFEGYALIDKACPLFVTCTLR